MQGQGKMEARDLQLAWVGWMLCGIPTQHQGCSRCGWGGPSFVLLQHRNIPVIALRLPPASPRFRKPIANASHSGHFRWVVVPPPRRCSITRCGWDAGRSEQAARPRGLRLARSPEQDQGAGSAPSITPRAGRCWGSGSGGALRGAWLSPALTLRTGKATGRRRSDPSASRHPPPPAGF